MMDKRATCSVQLAMCHVAQIWSKSRVKRPQLRLMSHLWSAELRENAATDSWLPLPRLTISPSLSRCVLQLRTKGANEFDCSRRCTNLQSYQRMQLFSNTSFTLNYIAGHVLGATTACATATHACKCCCNVA